MRQSPLPITIPRHDSHDVDAQYGVARIGGDFLDMLGNEDRMVMLLTDIAGERTDTHQLAVEVQEAFRTIAPFLLAPDSNGAEGVVRLLHETNRALMSAAGGVRCAPTVIAVYEWQTGIMTFVNAGAAPSILKSGRSLELIESQGVPLGLFTHLTHEARFLTLAPGDSLTLVSKGVLEARRKHEEFGMPRVVDVIENSPAKAVARNTAILAAAMHFSAPEVKSSFFGPSLHIPGFKDQDNSQDMTAFTLVRNS